MKNAIATFMFLLPHALHASTQVNMDYVPVGNSGNATDPATGNRYGSVAYAYMIGKHEVTNAQYAAFLNAVDPNGLNLNGIYNASMGSFTNPRGGISFNPGAPNGLKYTTRSHMDNKPVNYVSWYDAARFANWMHNGQGVGDTETGAYTLNGNTGIITKNANAKVWLPSEDEWYKAAYYDPTLNSNAGGYWLYATRSNTTPTVATANAAGDISNPGANVANYNYGAVWNNWYNQNGNVTTVGSAGANNYYGTTDQAGNVWEWNDMTISSSRGIRGGSWDFPAADMSARYGEYTGPTTEGNWIGFRVASVMDFYAAWAGDGGFDLATGRFDDDDQDGVTNFMEFALNGDPTNPADRGLIHSLIQDFATPVGNQLTLVVAVRRGAIFEQSPTGSQSADVDGVSYKIQGTLDLVDYSSAVIHLGVADTAPSATGLRSLAGSNWEYHTFRLADSESRPASGFMRVMVTNPQ